MIKSIKLFTAGLLTIVLSNTVQAQSLKFDEKMGEEASKQVEATIGIYEHPELTPYVKEVGKRLVDQLDKKQFDYEFNIVDEVSPNAFALPGGYIYITRGLLALINNVDELGCVLAHEVIHVNRRHSMKQVRRKIFPAVLKLPGNLVGVVAGENVASLLNAPIDISSAFFSANYSRKHETEADDLGVKLAVKAGFDPNQLAPILERLIKWEETLTDQKERKSYFADHPYTPDRVANLEKQTNGVTWENNEMHDRPYLDQVDGLTFWENPEKGVFVDSLFLHPEMNFSVVFPSGLNYINEYNAVGGKNEDEKRSMYLTLSDPATSPKETAKTYVKGVKKSKHSAKIKSKSVEINDKDAYLVTAATPVSYGKYVFTHVVWIDLGENQYMIAQESEWDSPQNVIETAASLHELTKKEKSMIKRMQVVVKDAKQDETVDELGNRNDNRIKQKLLFPLNGLATDTVLTEGQQVKIVEEVPYY